jgi:hypothetical protein
VIREEKKWDNRRGEKRRGEKRKERRDDEKIEAVSREQWSGGKWRRHNKIQSLEHAPSLKKHLQNKNTQVCTYEHTYHQISFLVISKL